MGYNSESWNMPLYLWAIDFLQGPQNHSIGERMNLSTNGAGETGHPYT